MRVSNSAPGKGEGGNTVPKVSIGLTSRYPCWIAENVSAMQGSEVKICSVLCFWLAATWRQHTDEPHAALQRHLQLIQERHRRALEASFGPSSSGRMVISVGVGRLRGRRKVPFNGLVWYLGNVQLVNCILGALRATLPFGTGFHGNFCSG